MPLDVLNLQNFYGSPLGGVARRLIGRVIRERWSSSAGLSVAAVGYGSPYLEQFRDGARRCLALMPAEQGAAVWPEAGRCAAALVNSQMLPLPDGSIDRLLLAHALEAADRPDVLMEELWRITAPEGRMIVIAPSRRGVWARTDSTPYGQGLPYSKSQLRDLLQRERNSRRSSGARRLSPTCRPAFHDAVGDNHRTDGRSAWVAVCGRVHRRGDQASSSAGRRP